MAKNPKKQIWDQAVAVSQRRERRGSGKGVEDLVVESPSLGDGYPFSLEKPSCVGRKGLYEVVSHKDS